MIYMGHVDNELGISGTLSHLAFKRVYCKTVQSRADGFSQACDLKQNKILFRNV